VVTESQAFVRIVQRHLSDWLRPSHVVRHVGVTIIFTDPRSTRVEVILWMIENLSVAERDYVRAAHGEPPVGEGPLSPHCVEGMSRPAPALVIEDWRSSALIVTSESELGQAM
jgi:hypothetical protein